MINIDKYAYSSKLKNRAPFLKFNFAISTMIICLWANSLIVSFLVLLVMGYQVVHRGGTPGLVFFKLLLLPASFLIIGVLTVGINISPRQEVFLYALPIGSKFIGTTAQSLREAVHLFSKALGAVSCLYYLSLTTPMVDFLALLRKLKTPSLLVELMGLIYRFIFLLLETAEIMFVAQNSRLGYVHQRAAYRSLASLASSLFIRAYKRSDELFTALEARGYTGRLNVLTEPVVSRWTEYLSPILINILLIWVAFFTKQYPGGFL